MLKCHFLLLSLSLFFSFSSVLSRLPKNLSPPLYSRYHLIFPEGIFDGSTVEYYGIAYISFGQVAYPLTQIQFHADLSYITLNNIFVNENEVKDYHYNNTNKVVNMTFSLNSNKNNELMLYINYTSRVSIYDTYGIYRAKYQTEDDKNYFLVTRFQPVFARRVLPCLDEPTFRSSYEFYISHPETLSVFGNKEGEIVDISDVSYMENSNLVTTRINDTSNISPHNLGFVISSDITCTALKDPKPITSVDTFRVCSRGTSKDSRNFALEKSAELIQAMNVFTDWPYSLMGIRKLEFVAIPNYPIDCSAYWGLIICREDLLLVTEKELSQVTQTLIVKNLARQIAQMWFGNLITNQWWSDKFLYGDALAGYFEYFLTNEVYPEMDLKNYFITQIIPQAFVKDSYKSSAKLQGDIFEADVDVFNEYQKEPSYKGAILLYMVEGLMGYKAFKQGIQYFVSSYKNRNPTVMDLWNMIDAQIDVSLLPSRNSRLYQIMDTWILQPGFPLVNVVVKEGSMYPYNPRKIVMSQERFIYDDKNETAKWFVPISYTLSSDIAQGLNVTPKCWLNLTNPQEIRYPWTEGFAFFDNQLTAFYIANLDDNLFSNVTKTLNNEFTTIPELSRTKILYDAFEMVKTNIRNYKEVFGMVEYLKNEESIYPWTVALKEFEFLLKRVGYETILGKAVSNHILRLLSTIYESVPWIKSIKDDYQYSEKQIQILTVACELGLQDCVDNALAIKEGQFESLFNLKGVIYCTQLKYGKNVTQWLELIDTYVESDDLSAKMMILDSLACMEDEELLFELLSLTIQEHTPTSIQEGLTIFKSVISHDNEVGVRIVLDFLKDNYEAILGRYGSQNCLRTIVKSLIDKFSYADTNLISELRTFIQNSNFPQNFKTSAKIECEKALFENQWIEKHWEELHEYYNLQLEFTARTSPSITVPASTTTSTTSSTLHTEITKPVTNNANLFLSSMLSIAFYFAVLNIFYVNQ